MTPSRGLAVLALAAMATTTVTLTPAEARTGAASADSVRYAWVKGCPKKDYQIPCGKWTLTLRSGRSVKLPDARIHPRNARGKVNKETSALFAVSGDGRIVNYFKGDKLVVRDVNSGRVRPLPGGAAVLPKSIGQDDVDTMISPDGSIVVIDYFDSAEKLPTLIVNLASGKTVKLPAKNNVLSFSPDGRHLLTGRSTDDNITEFAVFDADGRETGRQVVPQIVSNNSPVALADDASTVTLIITSPSNKARLRTYDLESDTVSEAVPLGIPKGETSQRLYWDRAGALTLWTSRDGGKNDITSAVKRTVNAETGSTRKLDSFMIKSGPWTWWLPGE